MSYDGIISNFFKREIIASWDCSFKQLVAGNNGLLGLSLQAVCTGEAGGSRDLGGKGKED